jgi:subtilisin family serine protease
VWTALPQAKAGPMSGTSFATPHVTAMVASVHAGATDRSKQGILSLFSTQDLGPAGPDPIYGRGLILAPSSCRPGGGSSIAATGGWGTTIVPAGLTRSR